MDGHRHLDQPLGSLFDFAYSFEEIKSNVNKLQTSGATHDQATTLATRGGMNRRTTSTGKRTNLICPQTLFGFQDSRCVNPP